MNTNTKEKTDNELIAEFMGLRVHTSAGVLWYCDDDGWIDWVDGAEPYSPDRSWNDLMPVVEKIESLGHNTSINSSDEYGHYVNIMFGRNKDERVQMLMSDKDTKSLGTGNTKIEAVYKAVVEFVKWYKTQNTCGNTQPTF